MAKVTTEKKTKTATKAVNDKKSKPKADKADKPKREPTAYQLFCKAHMKEWNEKNPGRAKEAMAQMALLWKDAPENPNRGAEPKARKPREPKPKAAPKEKASRSKAAATTKAKPKKKPAKDSEDDEDEDEQEEEKGGPSSEGDAEDSDD